MTGYAEYYSEDDSDDAYSTCSSVYCVGDVSYVTSESNDDVACISDIEDEDLTSLMNLGEGKEV